jgi:hypothetical protein
MAYTPARQPNRHHAPIPRLRSLRRLLGVAIIVAGASFGLAEMPCVATGTCLSPSLVGEVAASSDAGTIPRAETP